MSFEKLEIISSIKKALAAEGYEIPTPIQKQAIPVILEGRDILGSAQTGTGKTAAFAVPILQMLSAEKDHTQLSFPIQALILSPTRELALQIKESFSTYGRFTGLTSAVVFGGVPQKPQTDKLKKGVDILVATPGRLLDLLEQRVVNLSKVKIFVLDEADRMMDMGFIQDIKKVIKVLPEKRQNLLFSATLAPEIAKLASSFLHEPVTIDIEPESPTVDAITQGVYFVAKPDKKRLLVHLLKENDADSVIVFTRTKYGADNLSRYLKEAGIVSSAIHSDKE
ncbi:MAG: DEAD/DEAH box helicase, partial [Ignavibacteria bacterium]|nr:DEAD/DEAH box helicase [Ignavibacteria bacterium]